MPWQPHVRAVTRFLLGPPGTPREEASCTLNFIGSAPAPAGDKVVLANDIFADWATAITDGSFLVTQDVELSQVRLYSIGSDGRMVGDPTFSTAAAVRGVVQTNKHPWQCSVVLTLVAGSSGKGRFGRIYLPPMGYFITSDGVLADSNHLAIFNGAEALMQRLSNRPGLDAGWKLAVAGSTGASGTLREVTALRLGKVADTQRRRRRSLDEAYATRPFAA